MNYKICRNCNEKNNYDEKYCIKCGSDITKPANYDIISTNGSDTIYRIWSVSMSKFLAAVLTGIFLFGTGIVINTQYGSALKETTLGRKVVNLFDSDEDIVETSAINSQVNVSNEKNDNENNSQKAVNKSTNKTKQKKKQKGFVLPKSNKKVYSEKTLRKLSARKLAIARNEIYARHGYIFNDASWKRYFRTKSWYHEKYDSDYFNNHSEEILNRYEKKNIKRIKKIEREG